MWMVPKGAKTARGGEPVAPALAETLRIWYEGRGDHIDERHALVLVRHARRRGCWLACDCRGPSHPEPATPMLSPALLTEADTYYLRRLTGGGRAEHAVACPFFRAQRMSTTTTSESTPARNAPDGFFAVLKPAPVALAQAPVGDTTTRDDASHGTPRLAKLLWRLLEVSGRSTIPAVEHGDRTIASEFAAIKRAAGYIEVAPGIPLERVLFTHPRDWHSRRAFAVLRELAPRWPAGHEPQAFLLVYTKVLHEQSIETADGPIEIATRVRHPGTRAAPITGPDLALVAIGRHPDVRGYAAQRAWAQPIHNGHRFMPIEHDFDRDVVDALLVARRVLAVDGVMLTARKPMFDLMTAEGAICPTWQVTLSAGQQELAVVLSTRDTKPDTLERKALEFLGQVIDVDKSNTERLALALRRAWDDYAGADTRVTGDAG